MEVGRKAETEPNHGNVSSSWSPVIKYGEPINGNDLFFTRARSVAERTRRERRALGYIRDVRGDSHTSVGQSERVWYGYGNRSFDYQTLSLQSTDIELVLIGVDRETRQENHLARRSGFTPTRFIRPVAATRPSRPFQWYSPYLSSRGKRTLPWFVEERWFGEWMVDIEEKSNPRYVSGYEKKERWVAVAGAGAWYAKSDLDREKIQVWAGRILTIPRQAWGVEKLESREVLNPECAKDGKRKSPREVKQKTMETKQTPHKRDQRKEEIPVPVSAKPGKLRILPLPTLPSAGSNRVLLQRQRSDMSNSRSREEALGVGSSTA
ncbi:hypothetical protein K402DRAFT_401469 [Aulographum hederae CBS 113979]|uniref:Uncharacterized protein n=1 Tax=Aulographum hederae CBS 113979 TaxID=1176131 RepID=A0A6G1H9S4_9PEZI|nr:hypothetical protein K402DRAFT_401469 [Aulographum hederae CBS 113979]